MLQVSRFTLGSRPWPFRNLSHLSLPMRTGFGATRFRAAVTVLQHCSWGAVLPSSQFVDDHLSEGMNLSSPCAFAGLPGPVPGPLPVPLTAPRRAAKLMLALRSRSMTRPQC